MCGCLADRSAGTYTSYQSHEDRPAFSTGPRLRRQDKNGVGNVYLCVCVCGDEGRRSQEVNVDESCAE